MPRGAQPGERRGGRQKGTPNKVTLKTQQALWAYIEQQSTPDKSVNPFIRAVDLLRDSQDTAIILKCIDFLGDRLLPRLKAVELSGDPARPLTLTDATARQARITALLEKHTNGTD